MHNNIIVTPRQNSDNSKHNWAKKKQEFKNCEKIFRDRVDFDNYFMGLAFVVSTRSMDGQTRHGTLLVDNNNHIISTGYNSFPRKMPDKLLPNTRPAKYKWMLHSEISALCNVTVNIWQDKNIAAYITGRSCLNCLITLWNSGVKTFYMADRPGWQLDEEQKSDWDFFVYESGVEIYTVKPNLNWLKDLVEELKTYGFID